MSCDGAVDIAILFRGHGVFVDALVTDGVRDDLLLSWYDLVNLGVLPNHFPLPRPPPLSYAAAAAASLPPKNR